jgi:hypothetical protein
MSITLDGSNLTTVGVINSATAQASTSGTSITFSSIPSGVKRITVMFNGVSTSGSSNLQIQLGTGSTSYTTSGYSSIYSVLASATVTTSSASTGFIVSSIGSSNTYVDGGSIVLVNISGNTWIENGSIAETNATRITKSDGNITLGATLTAIQVTTVNGTDTFDAGSINILYE